MHFDYGFTVEYDSKIIAGKRRVSNLYGHTDAPTADIARTHINMIVDNVLKENEKFNPSLTGFEIVPQLERVK